MSVTMKEMLDAGVHFGHQTQRWNPKMKPYVYTSRGGIHIIDLQKTIVHAKHAADYVRSVAAKGGRLIFVGTKKQAVEPVIEAANKCGQYYVTKRWLGGMLTNFQTIQASIQRLRKIDQMREKNELEFFSKKERAGIEKDYLRLTEYLNGIREMKDMPSAMFVIDLNKEHIAVAEAKRLGIAVIGIADTNTNPEIIDFPIPGNDDAIRSIKLFANMVADAFNEGAAQWQEEMKKQVETASPEKEERDEHKSKAKQQPTEPGPAVFKFSKGRKLVAAGTADEVEIEMELESGEQTTETEEVETDAAESTETTTTKE
jgi:small subunit ribosomal protein S2